MKKILFVYGTRPEAIKMVPMIKELQNRKDKFEVKICVTGQHREMLDQVSNFFSIKPDYDLNVMKPDQSLFSVTARILSEIEPVIDEFMPDVILVQGDTTTALIGALSAYYKRIDVGHLEAGLRSGNIYSPFPEEVNRLLIDDIAKYHFAPTKRAVDSLKLENIADENIHLVGNTIIDALLLGISIIDSKPKSYGLKHKSIDWKKKVILVTGHRRESFGSGFEGICEAIKGISQHNPDVEIIYPVHLNPKVQGQVNKILKSLTNVHLIKPLDYPSLLWVMRKSYLVLTDSGGIQEEAPALGKPVLVMRDVTERQEGIDAGTAKLVGTDKEVIQNEVQVLLNNSTIYKEMANAVNPYGDGHAAKKIADILEIS